jgi:hypothetical protein
MSYSRRNDPEALPLPALEAQVNAKENQFLALERAGKDPSTDAQMRGIQTDICQLYQAIDDAYSDMFDGVEAYESTRVPLERLPRGLRGRVRELPINNA